MPDIQLAMKVSRFLARDDVILDLRAADKITLLRELARRAADVVHLPAETIFREMSKREQLGSTGIGKGIAIPHARFAGLKAPFGIVARLKPTVNFDSVDGMPVDIAFMLLAPASPEKDHLTALAAVSRSLRDRSVLEQLRSSRDRESFYRLLTGE